MDWDGLLNYLPGGPKAISMYAPYIMPPMSDYTTLEEKAALGLFPTIGAIVYPALFYAAAFGILRMILTHHIFRVCMDMEMRGYCVICCAHAWCAFSLCSEC